MKYVGVLTVFAVLLLSGLTHLSTATAISSSLVISQIQLGVSGASKQEFVELRNNSSTEVDVSDWCVTYSDYKDESKSTLKCFTPPEGVDELRVPPYGNILIASQTYILPEGASTSERFAGSSTDMSGARGHVRIMNATGVEVDKVAWDSQASTPPVSPEGLAALAPATGKSIARSGSSELIDTDNNFADFHEQVPFPQSSGVYEFVDPEPVIDLCQQDDIQVTMPDGYGYDEAGNCELLSDDICQNVALVQLTVPADMGVDGGNCYEDICTNLEGLQRETPIGYVRFEGTCTVLVNRALILTELLANVSGTDAGKEYIEIHNPFNEPVSLAGFAFQIGKEFEKTYQLVSADSDQAIAPHSFRYFRDDELGFTLLNTSSGVRLVAPAGNVVSETRYENPSDDMSWSYFDGSWAYTNQMTPGLPNEPDLFVDEEVVLGTVATLAPCGEGKYRHPVTNRCRNVEADASALASCDADEYRSPETNRCRKFASLASVTLAECEDGYERNPSTNRCRKLAVAETELKACEAGYERNPDTNRCRAIVKATGNAAALTDAPPAQGSLNWPAIGAISTIALGYAAYEWRSEVGKGVSRLRSRLQVKP